MEQIEKIEGDFAFRTGLSGGVLVKSATVGLWMALEALNLAPGSRVALSAIVCPQVLAALQLARLHPVFIDTSWLDFGIDPVALESTQNLSAIIAVHAFGMSCRIELLAQIAQSKGIPIIEDACLGYGVEGITLGKHARAVIVSFGTDKLVSAGGSGMILSNNRSLLDRFREIRSQNPMLFERSPKVLSVIEKALPTLHKRAETRKIRSLRYKNELTVPLTVPTAVPLWRFPLVLHQERTGFLQDAKAKGLFISTHYHPLNHFQTGSTLPITDEVCK